MNEALARIHRALSAAGFGVVKTKDDAALLVPCRVLQQDGAVRVSVSAGSSHFALILPIVCAPAQRATLALAVCEINLRLPLGSFRLDPSSGKLSFCVDEVDDGALEPNRHAQRLVACVRSVETHWPRLLRAWDEQGRTIADAAADLRGHRLAGAHPAPPSSGAHAGDVRAWLQNPRTNVAQAILGRSADTGAWFVKPVVHGCIVEEHEVDAVEWLARCTDELALAWCCDYPNPETQRGLEGLGFQGERLELLVERSLLAPLPPVPRGLSELGSADYPAALIDAVLCGTESPGLRAQSAESLLRPGARWSIWQQGGETIGVSLWTPAVDERVGVVDLLGLLPAQRGRRLGGAVHAATLRRLAAEGLEHYRDATDLENVAMQRIFFRNGCQLQGQVLHFSRLRNPAGAN